MNQLNRFLKLAKDDLNVRVKVRGLTLTLTFHISKPHSSGLDVGANVRGLTLTLTLALFSASGANVSLQVRGLTMAQTLALLPL